MLLPKIIQWIGWCLAALATVLYAYQVVYLFIPFFVKRKPLKPAKPHRFAILIAARNEAAVLPDLLESIRRQDYPEELRDVWVIADNCTDDTAECAARMGARVVTRQDDTHIGKGYALNTLLGHIRHTGNEYDAYLVIDADNVLRHDYLTQMNITCSQGYDVFCSYRNSKNFGTNLVSAGHSIWYIHDSTHLNNSRSRLGVPCMINGTGFGFTASLLKRCGGWNFFTLTEDLEFTTWCATHGIRVGYNHDAIFYDEQPVKFRQSCRQRTRWVQGGIQLGMRGIRQYLHGLSRGGMTAYATVEALSFCIWGYLCGIIGGFCTLLSILLLYGFGSLLINALTAVLTALLFTLLVGTLTVITEWDRIYATKAQKLMGIIAFPFFMLTYIPIAIGAIFRKYSWPPIEHTVRLSAEEIKK